MSKRIKFSEYSEDVAAEVIHIEPWLDGRCSFRHSFATIEEAVHKWDELVEANHRWGLLDDYAWRSTIPPCVAVRTGLARCEHSCREDYRKSESREDFSVSPKRRCRQAL